MTTEWGGLAGVPACSKYCEWVRVCFHVRVCVCVCVCEGESEQRRQNCSLLFFITSSLLLIALLSPISFAACLSNVERSLLCYVRRELSLSLSCSSLHQRATSLAHDVRTPVRVSACASLEAEWRRTRRRRRRECVQGNQI